MRSFLPLVLSLAGCTPCTLDLEDYCEGDCEPLPEDPVEAVEGYYTITACGDWIEVSDHCTGKDPCRYRWYDASSRELIGAASWSYGGLPGACHDFFRYGEVPNDWCDGVDCSCPGGPELLASSPTYPSTTTYTSGTQ